MARGANLFFYPVTIAANGTDSSIITFPEGGLNAMSLVMPSGWNAADITFKADYGTSGTMLPVYDDSGQQVKVTSPAADRFITLTNFGGIMCKRLQLIASASQTGGARTLYVGCKPVEG